MGNPASRPHTDPDAWDRHGEEIAPGVTLHQRPHVAPRGAFCSDVERKAGEVIAATTAPNALEAASFKSDRDHKASGAKDSKPRGTKTPMHLLPVRSLFGIAQAFGHGLAKGYERDSWKHARDDWRDAYTSAAMRHLCAIMDGEAMDPESGLPHAYHLGATVLVLIWHTDQDQIEGVES